MELASTIRYLLIGYALGTLLGEGRVAETGALACAFILTVTIDWRRKV